MAPPRLPQPYVEHLAGVLETVPAIARWGVKGRAEFAAQIHAGIHRITGFDPHQSPHDFATHLLGTAANVVPAYDGPRRGWPALGEILAVLLADPTVGTEDKLWIAALCVRYKLIPWDQPQAEIAPEVRAALAAV